MHECVRKWVWHCTKHFLFVFTLNHTSTFLYTPHFENIQAVTNKLCPQIAICIVNSLRYTILHIFQYTVSWNRGHKKSTKPGACKSEVIPPESSCGVIVKARKFIWCNCKGKETMKVCYQHEHQRQNKDIVEHFKIKNMHLPYQLASATVPLFHSHLYL